MFISSGRKTTKSTKFFNSKEYFSLSAKFVKSVDWAKSFKLLPSKILSSGLSSIAVKLYPDKSSSYSVSLYNQNWLN